MLIWQVGGLAWWLYKGHRRALSSLYQLLFSTKGGAGYAYRVYFYEIIWSLYLFLILGSMYSLCPFAAYYLLYIMESGRFSQCPAFLSRTAKERDKKYSIKSP
jgi:hypothetical protein